MSSLTLLAATAPPAGGAPTMQILIAATSGLLVTAILLALIQAHRTGRTTMLRRAADVSDRITGLPAWAALPAGVTLAGGASALFGVYWDISLHMDNGRDDGPLANPAHYFMLAGLFGIFAAGILAIALAEGQDTGRAALRLREGWNVPIGGALLLGCVSFGLLGFPLDDVWHRLFGQDVTLWGPTHVMMISGAGLAFLSAFSVLWTEGLRVRGLDRRHAPLTLLARAARVVPATVILLVVGLEAAEFDWGIPQFRQVWHPLLLAFGAGMALTLARITMGPGGAMAATGAYVAVRFGLSLLVGDALGQTMPAMPIFVVEALCVEGAALLLSPRRRPLAFGAAAGLLVGTAGFAFEYAWSQLVMPLPWTMALLPEALPTAMVAGLAAGILGTLFALAMRGELPRPDVSRLAAVAAGCALLAVAGNALVYRAPEGVRMTTTLQETATGTERAGYATVRFSRPDLARDAHWISVLAWQGGQNRILDRLRPLGNGAWRTTRPIPLHGTWKSVVRLHSGRVMLAAPLYVPRDPAIPVAGVTLPARSTQEMVYDQRFLQLERKPGVPAWLWNAAITSVLSLLGALLVLTGVGMGRLGRAAAARPSRPSPSRGLMEPTAPLPAA